MTTVTLKSPKQLPSAMGRLSKAVEREIVRGLRKAGRFGVTQAVRTGLTTRPRPHARGTYLRSWKMLPVKAGAVISNTSEHAEFVERGRRPGKRPPLKPIIEWIESKGGPQAIAPGYARMGRAGLRALAYVIARNIGRRGVAGRWVLKRSMPLIDAEAKRQIRAAIKRAMQKQ